MRSRIVGILAVGLSFAASATHSATLIDTGAGTGIGGVVISNNETLAQFYAGLFTLSDAVTISQVDGSLRVRTAGVLTISIYSMSGSTGLPDAELFSSSVALPADPDIVSPEYIAWRGVSGLNWILGAGSYWAVFGAPYGDAFSGRMPRLTPNPLARYAFTRDGAWFEAIPSPGFPGDAGIRLLGEYRAAVPEPGTLALFGLGLAGLGLSRKRKAN